MQIVIDIPDHLYSVIKNKECTNKNVLTKAVENGTPLPKVATNGDMIKAIFPSIVNSNMDLVDAFNKIKEWWNAPYKAESEG